MNLAEHIAAHRALIGKPSRGRLRVECVGAAGCDWSETVDSDATTGIAAHAAHVAAAWAEHRTVTTVKDGLDLPDGTVLRDAEGEVHLLHAHSRTPISLPARILHIPEEDQ